MAALEEACQMAVEERDFRVSLVSLFDLIDAKAVRNARMTGMPVRWRPD